MADPLLDFDRDIAPERNSFGLTAPETTFLNAKADQQMMPQLDLMMKLRGSIQRERAADLAYETSVFEFKQRKKDLRDQREGDQRAEELLQGISETLEDAETNPFEKQEALARMQLQNPRAFANSKVAQQSMLAASNFIGSQMQKRGEDQAKKIRKRTRKDAKERREEALEDTTGLDINFIWKFQTQEDVDDFEARLRKQKNFGNRQEALISSSKVALRMNQENKRKEEQERQDRAQKTIYANELAIAEDALDDADDLLRRLDSQAKAASDSSDSTTDFFGEFDGVTLGDGETKLSRNVVENRKAINDYRKSLKAAINKNRQDQIDFSRAKLNEETNKPKNKNKDKTPANPPADPPAEEGSEI